VSYGNNKSLVEQLEMPDALLMGAKVWQLTCRTCFS